MNHISLRLGVALESNHVLANARPHQCCEQCFSRDLILGVGGGINGEIARFGRI